MAVAEDMAKSINLEQEEKQAELIDAIIRERFPEEGVEQDMGAACILMNPANPKEAWKQMMRDVTDSINARLGGIVKNLEEGMSRGVHHYYSEESGYSVKRMSDNDACYGEFYKQHKRRPNKAELLEMAREVYKGGGDKYGMPEHTFEATEEMQEDFDALDQDFANMEVLEDIKEKIDTLPASEMAIMRGLTPSGYKVYQQARKQFESGNTDVQKAGRMNAILLARYAERMADNISKITGQEYTAEDYMRERIGIVPNASDAENGMYGQPVTNPAITLDTQVNVVSAQRMFEGRKWRDVRNSFFEEYPNVVKDLMTDKMGKQKHIPIINKLSGAKIVLSKNSIDHSLSDTTSSSEKKTETYELRRNIEHYELVPILKELIENGVLVEEHADKHQKADRVYRLYAAVSFNGEAPIGVKLTLKKEKANYSLVDNDSTNIRIYDVQHTKKPVRQPQDHLVSEFTHAGSDTGFSLSIAELLKDVNDNNGVPYINEDGTLNVDFVENTGTFNQTAYHGSPHKFDKFDLGAIGSGEGAQAHGWGLYFAQDKKVSERYQETLARKNRNKGVILYDGKEDAEVSNAIRYYGSAGLYSALSKESRDAVKAQKEISNILVGMHNDIERWDKQVKFYQKHIDRIKENPKLSITAFLKEAPKEDVSKLKDIVDDAKSFARMSGKRTNIKGVLDRLQTKQEMPLNEKDFLTRYANILENLDVDKLEIDVPTGSLLEVDIPENDVLLDEDKALSEQPEKVQKAIRECGKRVAIGKYVDYNGKTYKSVKGSLFGGWIDESDNKHVRRGSELEKELNKRGSSIYEKEYTYNIFKKDDTGVDVYSKLVKELGSPKEASQKLNELGIKGITYEGYRDGRCYVVFDDKAISIIERYNQSAAMRREYFPSMKAFIEYLESNTDRYPKIGNWVRTSKGGEFIISGSAYKHVQKDKHPLTLEQWQALVDNIENVEYVCVDHAKGINNGIPVQIKINTPLGKAGVSMEFLQNGKVLLSTAVFNNDAALDNWIKNKKSSQTLELENKDNQERILSNSSFIDIIQSELGIVNRIEQRPVASMVRGQTKIGGMSRVVSLFESADKSTFVHELGHVALADLKMLAEMDHAPQQLVRDWQTVKEWLGYKDSQGFTREQHERFARGFEAYLRTGEAPVRGLKAVFRTFKKWLCDIYADFIQLGIYNTRLTEVNLSALFDRVIYLLSMLQFASCQA